MRWSLLAVLVLIGAAACGNDDDDAAVLPTETPPAEEESPEAELSEATETEPEELFPDIVDVSITPEGDETFRFDVTVSSPYDTPQRYADAWRVVTLDGEVLGERILAHDHQAEQPFTRSLGGVEIPPDVEQVRVEGRDQVSGWGGQTQTVEVPR